MNIWMMPQFVSLTGTTCYRLSTQGDRTSGLFIHAFTAVIPSGAQYNAYRKTKLNQEDGGIAPGRVHLYKNYNRFLHAWGRSMALHALLVTIRAPCVASFQRLRYFLLSAILGEHFIRWPSECRVFRSESMPAWLKIRSKYVHVRAADKSSTAQTEPTMTTK